MGSEIINHFSVREPRLRRRCRQRCAHRAGAELWDLGWGAMGSVVAALGCLVGSFWDVQ